MGDNTLAEKLEVSELGDVDLSGQTLGGLSLELLDLVLTNNVEELLNVQRRDILDSLVLVEVTHTVLAEVVGVEHVELDAVVVLTAGETTTSGVAAVLA